MSEPGRAPEHHVPSPGYESVFAPDDHGRDAFERFRYQAHVAFPFCLAAASDAGGIEAVACEHFEDVAALDAKGWRLMQIKTRNPDLGTWTLTDLLGDGGALRGLHRTFSALDEMGQAVGCRLEAWLEGSVARRDNARVLTEHLHPDGAWEKTVARCKDRLMIDHEAAERFLTCVRIVDGVQRP